MGSVHVPKSYFHFLLVSHHLLPPPSPSSHPPRWIRSEKTWTKFQLRLSCRLGASALSSELTIPPKMDWRRYLGKNRYTAGLIPLICTSHTVCIAEKRSTVDSCLNWRSKTRSNDDTYEIIQVEMLPWNSLNLEQTAAQSASDSFKKAICTGSGHFCCGKSNVCLLGRLFPLHSVSGRASLPLVRTLVHRPRQLFCFHVSSHMSWVSGDIIADWLCFLSSNVSSKACYFSGPEPLSSSANKEPQLLVSSDVSDQRK